MGVRFRTASGSGAVALECGVDVVIDAWPRVTVENVLRTLPNWS